MNNTYENKYFFLINPNAGNSEGKREWSNILEVINKNNLDLDFAFTEFNGHAEQIVLEQIKVGHRNFIIVGGDGTVNEVINAVCKQNEVSSEDISLGIIQMGTGNDWSKYYEFDNDYQKAIDRFKQKKTKFQDVGLIRYKDESENKEAYFINIAGLCFDSVVVKATNQMKARGKRTRLSYMFSLLKNLINYKPWHLKIHINDEILEGKFLSISIGNGKYSGGGMLQTPDAIIDDGWLDVTIYENMPKFKIAINVGRLFNGSVSKVRGVRMFKTKKFLIESEQEIFAETDGEIIGSTPYEISIIPKAVKVFV
ncbi:MAG: diacylglycerol/lipid kinase family protein [Salinivirgaceae bacterium]|nr:diacylglycerol kinase family lipid kinase [Bacteroidales bacterium]